MKTLRGFAVGMISLALLVLCTHIAAAQPNYVTALVRAYFDPTQSNLSGR